VLPGQRFERGDECFAVESRVDGAAVVIELVHHRRGRSGKWHHEWTRVETLASESFSARDMTGYWAYAGKVEEAARHALDGQLGCYVDVQSSDAGEVRIRLVERRLRGRDFVTEILEQHLIDASADGAVAASAELTEELRARARMRNEQEATARAAEVTARAERALGRGDRAREADELARILREERGG
jgi:hypothetical protein